MFMCHETMNREDSDNWKKDVLGHILLALAASDDIKDLLIFKGALVLNIHLGNERMSLDIDSNLVQDFLTSFPEISDQIEYLEERLRRSITRYFTKQNPVRYELSRLNIKRSPPKDHPRGWDAFTIRLNITDHQNSDVRTLPALKIDIAAPEELSAESVKVIQLGSYHVKAYTLERIAGEKLRAFLSTLPHYRAKVLKPGEAVRVKDLYDIARVFRVKPISNESFWLRVGEEFRLASASRFIDCQGIESFQQEWENTRKLYEEDPTLPKDILFDEIEKVVMAVSSFFTERALIPFYNPLPVASNQT